MKMFTKLAPVLLSLLLSSGCATNIKRADGPPQPPAESFAGFDGMILRDVVLSDGFKDSPANVKATKKIQENLTAKIGTVWPGATALGAGEAVTAPEGKRTLLVEPVVEEIKFIGGAARFWAGAMAGSSAVYMKVKFTDATSGKELAHPEFYQQANATGGAYSFGATDNNMLDRIAGLIADYVSLHRSK